MAIIFQNAEMITQKYNILLLLHHAFLDTGNQMP